MSKEAMKLALEVLKITKSSHDWTEESNAAIKSLEEALAKQEQGEPVAWNDRKDEWTDEIAAHHPTKTKAYKHFDTAMLMVGARHSKSALVELVCWLLQKSTPPQRTWVGMNWSDLPEELVGNPVFMEGAKWAEAELKGKNT